MPRQKFSCLAVCRGNGPSLLAHIRHITGQVVSIYILLLIAVLANALASVLLKAFNLKGGDVVDILNPMTMVYVGSAVTLYFVAFLVYAALLKTIPLSKAYIVMTSGVQLVLVIVGSVFFKEKITFNLVIGMSLIFAGMFFLSSKGIDG